MQKIQRTVTLVIDAEYDETKTDMESAMDEENFSNELIVLFVTKKKLVSCLWKTIKIKNQKNYQKLS